MARVESEVDGGKRHVVHATALPRPERAPFDSDEAQSINDGG